MDHLQKSWLLYEAIRAQVVMASNEIVVQRVQGYKDPRGQVNLIRQRNGG